MGLDLLCPVGIKTQVPRLREWPLTTTTRLCNGFNSIHPHLFLGPSFFIQSFSSIQSLSHVQLFVTPWTAACKASLSITNSQSLLKLMSVELVMPYTTISSSVVPFSSCPQTFLASGSFPVSWLFASGGQSIGASSQCQRL